MTGGNKSGTDIGDGHIGLAVTIIALIVIAIASGPQWALIVAGCFIAWFVLALIVIHIRGGRGGEALGRAYVATFWWGDYINP
ncbi:hypothetical protein ADK41_33215 [Streptomyces caelestis]|uniref:Uncharacterized protein n=1 Tax=Streptomyces caelestis TaxID=36816 RepID=A0A0M8QDG1_9ACTN|nr:MULTISPECIES: hypothetical protein [Streptomyces]KOT30165.1 hypothetical protein ADK41_33215 [Streptomyces caelestis]